MAYSLSLITTIADCNALIVSAQRKQRDIQYRKTQQERQYETVSEGGSSTEATLAATIAEIAGLEPVVLTLPEGPTKKELEDRIVTLKYKRFVLENRRLRYGVFAMLEKEYMMGSIDKELLEVAAYIDALNDRKAEL